VWADPAGPTGPGKPAEWSGKFKPLASADEGDWWSKPPGGSHYQPTSPGAFSRALRKPTPRELCQRAGSLGTNVANGLSCTN